MENMIRRLCGQDGLRVGGRAADFIVVNMVAEAASGSKTPKEAAERVQRAERYYKVDSCASPPSVASLAPSTWDDALSARKRRRRRLTRACRVSNSPGKRN
jgi:hypothetical protein